ncbi:MAG: hemerythrin domain-containing protein [Burkholderiales bacterium]|nr:hemerythrin domain-containing protein [Burkholderiales bacterium]
MDACLPGATPLPKRADDTQAPIAQLTACHGRLGERCARLLRLVAACGQAQGGPAVPRGTADIQAGTSGPACVDAAFASAASGAHRLAAEAADLIRFFDYVIVQHHADEEEDLFPALIESMAGSDAVCLREMTEALRSEHRLLEADWRELRRELEQVASGAGTSGMAPAAETGQRAGAIQAAAAIQTAQESAGTPLARSAQRFADRLHAHSAREDDELLPMAERLLSDEELAMVAAAMQRRRARAADAQRA